MINWAEKFEFDLTYNSHFSFLYDFKIIYKTIKNVVCRRGVSEDSALTETNLAEERLVKIIVDLKC